MKKKDKRPKPKKVHSVDGAEEEDKPSVYIDTITSGKDQPDTAYNDKYRGPDSFQTCVTFVSKIPMANSGSALTPGV